jgi:hypothetical protein
VQSLGLGQLLSGLAGKPSAPQSSTPLRQLLSGLLEGKSAAPQNKSTLGQLLKYLIGP